MLYQNKYKDLDISRLPDIRAKAREVNKKDKSRTGRYLDFGSPEINNATLGLEFNTFFIPAPPNLGKSHALVNLYCGLIQNTKDVQIIDLSYDDAFDTRMRIHIARLAHIPINWVKYPQGIPKDADKARTTAMMDWNENYLDKLQIIDQTELEGRSRNLSNLEKIVWYYKDVYQGKKLVICIDGLHNIYPDNYPHGSNAGSTQLETWVSDRLKNLAETAEVTIMASAQVSKNSDRRGGTAFAIKGAGTAGYDAGLVGTVYSDYKLNKGNAEIWHEADLPHDNTKTYKLPVIELDITKNKVSEYSDIIFFKHYPLYGLVEEATQSWQEHWREVVYGRNKNSNSKSNNNP